MPEEEMQLLFKHVANVKNLIGSYLSVSFLRTKVFDSTKALLLDKIDTAISHSQFNFGDLLKEFDRD